MMWDKINEKMKEYKIEQKKADAYIRIAETCKRIYERKKSKIIYNVNQHCVDKANEILHRHLRELTEIIKKF